MKTVEGEPAEWGPNGRKSRLKAERGGILGEGAASSLPTSYGSGRALWVSPEGFGTEPRPPKGFDFEKAYESTWKFGIVRDLHDASSAADFPVLLKAF